MPRPKTKIELQQQSAQNFDAIFALINVMSDEEQNKSFAFEDRDKNIRDILVHLYEWHQLFIIWVKANKAGAKQAFLPEPYNFKTYPKMNIEIWKKHQKTAFDESIKMVKQSHQDVMEIIDRFSNEELFTKKYYDWTGTTSLGSYAISATSSSVRSTGCTAEQISACSLAIAVAGVRAMPAKPLH